MNITICLESFSYNQKHPKLKIYNNGILLDDVECHDLLELKYDIEPNQYNTLIIEFYNKSFGDDNVWDVGQDGEIKLKLTDLKFDGVSIDHLLNDLEYETRWTPNQLTYETDEIKSKFSRYKSHGLMTFNGRFSFEYETPILDFLIKKKYKTTYDSSIAYFSNYTEMFNYDIGLKVIEEIKEIIKLNEKNTSSNNT